MGRPNQFLAPSRAAPVRSRPLAAIPAARVIKEQMVMFDSCRCGPVSCSWFLGWLGPLALATALRAQEPLDPDSPLKPLVPPRMQVIPQPYGQAAVLRDGREITRYHFGEQVQRPFLFPLIGPAGESLTRMGHPRDPHSHSHHNSVWLSHSDVGGVDFWTDRNHPGRIVHDRVVEFDEANDFALIASHNRWLAADGALQLEDDRRYRLEPLAGGELLLTMDVELHAPRRSVTLGKTPFGLLAVRMAKTIGVHDGAGRIRNSAGAVNEEGVFWKPARWCDYSGAVTATAIEGVTLLDHPRNVNHPTVFHVRNDGWMGAALTFDGPRTIEPGQPLRLRYGLYVHAGLPPLRDLEARWKTFAQTTPPATLSPPRR
jgi:Methane oxygenase PmoA